MICPGKAFRDFLSRAGLPVSVQQNLEVHLVRPQLRHTHHDVECIVMTEALHSFAVLKSMLRLRKEARAATS